MKPKTEQTIKQSPEQNAAPSCPPETKSDSSKTFALWLVLVAVLLALAVSITALITNSIAGQERDALFSQLSLTENQLNQNQQQLEETRSQLEQTQSQLNQNQSQLEQAQNQLNAQQSELKQNQELIDQYKSAVSSLTEQVAAKKKVDPETIAPVIYAPEDAPVCYLTFDDGPSENTLKILDILKGSGISATFFVKGTSKIEYVKNIEEAGCAVGLHTDTHDYKTVYASDEAYFNDLAQVGSKVQNILGYTPNIIRFPGGSSNLVSKKYNRGIMSRLTQSVQQQGYSYFDWNCDSGDASGNNVAVSKLLSNIQTQTGSQQKVVVLMHDTDAKDTTVQALPQIIEFYRSKGYRFGKLSAEIEPVHHGVNN